MWHHPVFAERGVGDDVEAVEDDAVAKHVHREPLADGLDVEAVHLEWRVAVVVRHRVAVFAAGEGEGETARARGVDRREFALPDRALVGEAVVHVAGDGDAVRMARENLAGGVERGVGVALADRAGERFVLHEEERPVRGEPSLDPFKELRGRVPFLGNARRQRIARRVRGMNPRRARPPVHEHEKEALHLHDARRRVGFAEKFAPPLVAVEEERIAQRLLAGGELAVGVEKAVDVVVSGDENALDLRAVGAAVLGEDLAPSGGGGLELEAARPGGEVAGDEHGVDTLGVETAERLHEPLVAGLRRGDVNVGQHADAQGGGVGGGIG